MKGGIRLTGKPWDGRSSSRPFADRHFHKRHKHGVGGRSRSRTPWSAKLYRATHGEFSYDRVLGPFGDKRVVLGIVLIALVIGGAIIWNSPAFHSQGPNPAYHHGADPFQPLFYYCAKTPNGDTSQWNTRTGSNPGTTFTITKAGSCGNSHIDLTPNSTASAFGIFTGAPVELGPASSHILAITLNWKWAGAGNNPTWHMFLTTNKTAPSQLLSYDPRSFSTTVFSVQGVGGANSFTIQVQVQTDQAKTIFSTTNNQGACGAGDSLILCSDPYGNNTLSYGTQVFLNYTGSSGSQTTNQLQITNSGANFFQTTTSFRLPPAFNQITPLYWGVEADPTINAKTIEFFDNVDPPLSNPFPGPGASVPNSLFAGIFSPPTTASQPPPYVDTGGFFGPVIHALITVGVFISQNLINFGSFLVSVLAPILASWINLLTNVIVGIFNAIGGLWGDSSLGTQMSAFVNDFLTFLNNAFSNLVGLVALIVTMINNITTFITNFFNTANFTTLLFGSSGFLGALVNLWTIINGVWADVAKWFINGTLTAVAILQIDWVIGMLWTAIEKDLDGFNGWLDFNLLIIEKLFGIAYWLFELGLDVLYKIVMIVKGRVAPFQIAAEG